MNKIHKLVFIPNLQYRTFDSEPFPTGQLQTISITKFSSFNHSILLMKQCGKLRENVDQV
jgi:hypothetical protein